MKKVDELDLYIRLKSYRLAINIGWIVAVVYFIIGLIYGRIHIELAFIPFVQYAVYFCYKLILEDKITGERNEGDEE